MDLSRSMLVRAPRELSPSMFELTVTRSKIRGRAGDGRDGR